MCSELHDTTKKLGLRTHSFVLMSNHFHLIASTPNENISQCMHRFMQRTSHRLALAGNRINESYAGRHYKCILQHQNYFLNAYKYNYRNPVASGICKRVEDYPFSTLPWIIGIRAKKFELCEDTIFKNDPIGTLNWLNSSTDPIKGKAFRWGTRYQYFRNQKCRNTRKPILSENDLI